MGIPTLISTSTASNAASVAITSGIDSTYDEYMFVCTDMGPATDGTDPRFQCSIDSGSNYNVAMTTTSFRAYHNESDAEATLAYQASADQTQGTAYQQLLYYVGSEADESWVGILHLFSPSNTTYVKNFYATIQGLRGDSSGANNFVAGYFNTTSAIDAISFKMSSGNLDGGIQMYGIA